MKRRILLTCVALGAMLSAMAQRHYTFNAVALNVDGLPEKISGVTVNEGAPGADGATAIGNAIAMQNWDIIGLSEDFDYHENLVAPLTNYFHVGTWRGKIDIGFGDILVQNSADTDGLGLLVSKRDGAGYTGETYVKWNTYNGYTDQGADGLIKKGFRYYAVSIASGIVVDVYVLHMDANDNEADINARNSQLTQLANYIKNNKHGRPIIIMGDSNCRYNRDKLKTNLIDAINADSRLTIKDVWVEHMWGGEYPAYGSGAMMTDTYGEQKGEVVDKIFYINDSQSTLTIKANSYFRDATFDLSDHAPVIANFTLTNPNGTPLTNAEKENNWTLEETVATFTKPTWEGEKVVSGTTYYLMNVGTGECIRTGGAYYTQAVAGNAALKITPTTSNGGTTWVLGTYRGKSLGTGGDAYTDQSGEWYLEQVSGTTYQYRLKNTGGTYLTATTTDAHHPVRNMAGNASDDNQKWIFLTDARIRTEMNKANADYPFNFTALLKSADFDVIEFEDGWTAQGWTGFDQANGPFKASGHNWGGDALAYSAYAYANQKNAATMSQSLGTLPNGIYDISFTGFYRSKKNSNDETISAVVKFGSTSISVKQNKGTNIGDFGAAEQFFRVNNNTYRTNQQITLRSSTSITLQVTKPSSSSTGWICVDNFRLLYYGTSTVAVDPYKEYKDMVLAKVNETYPKVMALNAAGQAAYDISVVIERYNNDQITTAAIAQAMCDIVDNAYANALAAHLAYIVNQAIKDMQANGGDLTGAIINPSFETGDLTGWTVGEAWDLGAKSTSDGTYASEGSDGDYLFNAYSGDHGHTTSVMQTIKGIPNGLYELKAMMTSFGATEHVDENNPKTQTNRVYLVGNSYHTSIAAERNNKFEEATLYFLVEDGTAVIGAIGGNKGGGADFIHYWPWEGCYFKADNFRLKRICDVPHGRLKLALMDAENAALDAYGKATLDINTYQTTYNNKSLTGDGKTEAAAVYTALQTAAKAQRTKNADMTWAITNPSFETGDYTGWTTVARWDTGAREQANGTYSIAGTDGRYMFNTWNNAAGADESGVNPSISQTVTGIPNGTYRLRAMVATDNGNSMMLTGNGVSTTIAASTNGASSGVFPEVTCDVTNGKLAIEVVGVNNCWYKCDDFHLTLVTPAELRFSDAATVIATIEGVTYPKVVLERTIKGPDKNGNPTWASFVAPFDIPQIDGWEYRTLSSATYNESTQNISLTFSTAETIEAGAPYMVRCTTLSEGQQHKELPFGEMVVNTVTKKDKEVAITNGNSSKVIFKGVYTAGNVPQGAFFISNNTFYQAADNTNTIKGFRAYIEVSGALASKARSMSLRWDDEDTTGVDAGAEEVTTVAIYDINGVRLSEMQQGINILLMSDGSVVKIMVK